MSEKQRIYFHDLILSDSNISNQFVQYWKQYSSYNTWQFWTVLLAILLSLVVLYFFIDRQHIFFVGFFGFSVHMLFVYIDITAQRLGLLGYPYHVYPLIPNITISAAIIPISMMLIFQWTYKHNKNYYFYAFLSALFFAFIFKPIITYFGFFVLYRPTNYMFLSISYMVMFLIAYWLTKGFLWLQKQVESEVDRVPRRGRDTGQKTTPQPDGFKEGVMNDPTGVQYGIEVGHEKLVNPADIAKMTSEKSDRKSKVENRS